MVIFGVYNIYRYEFLINFILFLFYCVIFFDIIMSLNFKIVIKDGFYIEMLNIKKNNYDNDNKKCKWIDNIFVNCL